MTSHKIKSIRIDGGFLKGVTIQFDDHLNCLIGGRGTGKTTILEFIRFALGYMPDERIEPRKARDLQNLITANLREGNAITLEIASQEGAQYSVRRKSGDDAHVIKDTAGNIRPIDLKKAKLFDADIFSQNDIENAASNPLDQLKIIDRFREEELTVLAKEISGLIWDLETNAGEILNTRNNLTSLQDDVSEIEGIGERLKALTIDAGEDPAEVSQHGAQIQAIGREQKVIERLTQGLDESMADLKRWWTSLERISNIAFPPGSLTGPDRGLLEGLQMDWKGLVPEIQEGIQWMENTLTTFRQKADQVGRKIEGKALILQSEYEDIMVRHQAIRVKVQERDRLQKYYDDLVVKQGLYDQEKEHEESLGEERRQMLRRLSELNDKRCRMRDEIADMLNQQLSPMIRVQIVPMGNASEYQALLNEAMKRSQMQYTRIVERIVERIHPTELTQLIQNGQVQVLMEKLEIDRERANKIVAQLQNTRDLFAIEAVELYDKPLIELKDGASYKAADRLSTGQKCTTILPILLLESERPLIIDQPEDNLDNAFVYDTVVKSVRKAKGTRQLIFVTHNPNIPVLGDAEKVVVLHSDGDHGEVIAEGNVDMVKQEIETILEGGSEAFEERRRRYGH